MQAHPRTSRAKIGASRTTTSTRGRPRSSTRRCRRTRRPASWSSRVCSRTSLVTRSWATPKRTSRPSSAAAGRSLPSGVTDADCRPRAQLGVSAPATRPAAAPNPAGLTSGRRRSRSGRRSTAACSRPAGVEHVDHPAVVVDHPPPSIATIEGRLPGCARRYRSPPCGEVGVHLGASTHGSASVRSARVGVDRSIGLPLRWSTIGSSASSSVYSAPSTSTSSRRTATSRGRRGRRCTTTTMPSAPSTSAGACALRPAHGDAAGAEAGIERVAPVAASRATVSPVTRSSMTIVPSGMVAGCRVQPGSSVASMMIGARSSASPSASTSTLDLQAQA